MSKPKKQHFIPQFVLRGFAKGKKDKAKLWTFDKETGRAFLSAVKDTAHENQFYKGTNLDGDCLEREDLMRYVDGLGAEAIQQIIRTQTLPLSGKAPVSLSYFVAAQMFRVPAIRNEMDVLRKTVISKWGPEIRYADDDRPISAYSHEDSKFSSLLGLQDVPEIARLLQTKTWFLLRAPLEACFILSDNPVVRHNYIDYWPRGSLGLKQDGIDVYLPISPRLAVQFICPKMANLLRGTSEGRRMLEFQNKGEAVPVQVENVTFVNSLQVIYCERFLYSRREADFDLAKDMIREHPDLARPASTKIIAN